MTIRDRLKALLDEGILVELFFAPANNYYLARILRVGQDYVEFDAYDDEENVIAHNIMPLQLLTGVTTSSIERSRDRLEILFRSEQPDKSQDKSQ